MEKIKLLETKNIIKKYKQNGNDLTILENINMELFEGEIVGILGRSGSGKSTFLRILSDLIAPNSGEILYRNKPIAKSSPKIAMIFQTFGLIPWLTVFDNVALGLEDLGLSKIVIEDKVLKAINLVGLRGYEEAYPKAMSGGMRQRVGFARALVIDPEILLMDEPFSALDYLTGNALKGDLLDLWFNRNLSSIKTIILVTHSIEEAVSLCDRVIVFSSNPGKVIADVHIDIPHPRESTSKKFNAIMEDLYSKMTNTKAIQQGPNANADLHKFYPQRISGIHLIHFLEEVKKKFNTQKIDLSALAENLELHDEDMIMYIEALTLLKFLEADDDGINLSSTGNIFLDADEDAQKVIFREHLVKDISFIKDLYCRLQDEPETPLFKVDLMALLQQKFTEEKATQILLATISWARYANLFAYDDLEEKLSMDENFH